MILVEAKKAYADVQEPKQWNKAGKIIFEPVRPTGITGRTSIITDKANKKPKEKQGKDKGKELQTSKQDKTEKKDYFSKSLLDMPEKKETEFRSKAEVRDNEQK